MLLLVRCIHDTYQNGLQRSTSSFLKCLFCLMVLLYLHPLQELRRQPRRNLRSMCVCVPFYLFVRLLSRSSIFLYSSRFPICTLICFPIFPPNFVFSQPKLKRGVGKMIEVQRGRPPYRNRINLLFIGITVTDGERWSTKERNDREREERTAGNIYSNFIDIS